MKSRKGSAGGKKMAIIQREMAIKKYYENPNQYLNCNKVIEVGKQKVSQIKGKRFCGYSCSAKYYNSKKQKTKTKIKICQLCGKGVLIERGKNGRYRDKKYCSSCFLEVQARHCGADTHISNLTKKQVFDRYDRYYIGRAAIRKHAKKVFDKSKKDKKCFICGYDKHIDVAHIKSVSDFSNDCLISEINNELNLVGLCLNHHWEYDHGLISLKK